MSAMGTQITSLTIVYSTVYSDADQRKHQSFASLAFVRASNAENVSIWWRHHETMWVKEAPGRVSGEISALKDSTAAVDMVFFISFVIASANIFVLIVLSIYVPVLLPSKCSPAYIWNVYLEIYHALTWNYIPLHTVKILHTRICVYMYINIV